MIDELRLENKIRYNKHKKRKNNDIVAAMYAMYCLPKSLEEIGKVYRKSRQAIYDVFRSRGYKLRSKEMKGLQVLDGINFSLTKGGHLRGTVNGVRILMHHYVWQKSNGPILPGHCVWHKDRNPSNNSLDNLEMIPKSLMGKHFNPSGKNQFSK